MNANDLQSSMSSKNVRTNNKEENTLQNVFAANAGSTAPRPVRAQAGPWYHSKLPERSKSIMEGPGLSAHTCAPSTREAEQGESLWVLQRESRTTRAVLKNTKTKQENIMEFQNPSKEDPSSKKSGCSAQTGRSPPSFFPRVAVIYLSHMCQLGWKVR